MLSLLWVERVPCSRGKGQLVMHLLGFSTSIFSVKCFKLPWLNRWGNGKTEHGKSSMIIKNSSLTKKKHDLRERTLHVRFLVRESRWAHPPVCVTHLPWGALGLEENCVSPRRAVSRVLFRERKDQVSRRSRGMSQRAGGGKGVYCVLPPLQGTLFCVDSFSWRRKPFSWLLQTQRGCWVPNFWGRCLAMLWLPGAQQPNNFGLHTSATRPHLLKFLKSANYRPTMQLKY